MISRPSITHALREELAEVEAEIDRLRADRECATYRLEQALRERGRLERHLNRTTGGGAPLDRTC